MTRDEAIAQAKKTYFAAGGNCSEASFGASIAVYVALGMLKLDESSDPLERICDSPDMPNSTWFEDRLRTLGLKIVQAERT